VRQLATIQVIAAIEPITGADAIQRARVLGWWVVVKSGEYLPGDPVVYCEVDSLVPERPEFEFLRKSSYRPAIDNGEGFRRPAGFRIKTIKLRGQVSQGICLPLSVLPPGTATEVGTDVKQALGVVKYQGPPPVGMTGRIKGPFPGFLPKTDETRVQVLGEVLATHRGKRFAVSEKLDGTSFTAYLRGDDYGICSRNLLLDETDEGNLLCRLALGLDVRGKLAELQARFGHSVAVQAEVIGPGIQKNKYLRQTAELRVFSLVNADTGRLIDRDPALTALDAVGFLRVPDLAPLTLNHTVDQLVELSVGTSVVNPAAQREGIVLRPFAEVDEPLIGGRLSFKVLNPQFLLKYDE